MAEPRLREALAVRERRRVRRDTTLSVLGRTYELKQGFLAGRVVDIVSHLDDPLTTGQPLTVLAHPSPIRDRGRDR